MTDFIIRTLLKRNDSYWITIRNEKTVSSGFQCGGRNPTQGPKKKDLNGHKMITGITPLFGHTILKT